MTTDIFLFDVGKARTEDNINYEWDTGGALKCNHASVKISVLFL